MKKTLHAFFAALLGAGMVLGGVFLCPAGETASAAEAALLTDTYQAETALVDPPTVVFDVMSGDSLASLEASLAGERPSNAILHVGAEGSVKDGSGNTIGALSEIVEKIRHKVIPVLAVSEKAEADAVIAYIKESGLIDTAVLSEDPVLVKSVRDTCPDIRGVVKMGGKDTYSYVKTATENKAGVVMLDLADASYETVTYLQARFKAVWVVSNDEFDDYAAISSGAYGIVTEDFSATYDAISSFTEKTYARMPFNVCHRGLPKTHNENSVSGTRAAIAAGATHVELDGKITTDGEIVMMHDDAVDRTSDGKGDIESMTLAEAQALQLDLFEPKEPVPTLKEIIPLFKDTNAVLVFEIKTKKPALIARLKQILDETDFYDHIVVIAFDLPQLEEMNKLLPEVPVADLNSYSESNFATKLSTLGKYNCAISTNGSSTKEFNEKYLRDRGIIGWYWTQESEAAVDTAFERGLVGLTNNVGAYFGGKIDIYRVVLASQSPDMGPLSVGASIPVRAVKYDGTIVEGTGEVFRIREDKSSSDPRDPGYYDVIAKYVSGNMTYYTPVARIGKQTEEKGCAGSIGIAGAVTGGLILALSALIVIKKKT